MTATAATATSGAARPSTIVDSDSEDDKANGVILPLKWHVRFTTPRGGWNHWGETSTRGLCPVPR